MPTDLRGFHFLHNAQHKDIRLTLWDCRQAIPDDLPKFLQLKFAIGQREPAHGLRPPVSMCVKKVGGGCQLAAAATIPPFPHAHVIDNFSLQYCHQPAAFRAALAKLLQESNACQKRFLNNFLSSVVISQP
jgi:hypothetical protein